MARRWLHSTMRMITGTVIAPLMLSIALCEPGAAASDDQDETTNSGVTRPALFALPAETDVIVVIPSLKVLSDQITQSLEGMDRANLLIGSRPLDQMKAALGFNVGVNDLGSLAIGITRGEDGEMVTTFVVPVNDAEAFLNGNFTARNGDALTLPTGRAVHGKVIDGHVVISTSAKVIQNHPPVRSAVERLAEFSNQAIAAMVNRGEIFMVVNEAGLSDTMVRALTKPPLDQLAIRADDIKQLVTQSCVEGAIISVDFDALGLIVRSMVRFKIDSSMSAIAAQPQFTSGDMLRRMSSKTYYTAGGLDTAGFNSAWFQRLITELMGLKEVPQWITDVKEVQFAAYPSPTGVAGGLLNDAAIVVRTSQPQSLLNAMRECAKTRADEGQSSGCTVQWEADLKADDPIGTTDAYEIRFAPVNPDAAKGPTITLVRQMLFGRVGWRGFVKTMDDAVMITFSRRPAVLEAAMNDRAAEKGGLGSNASIRTMRRMFPNGAAAEMYFSVSSIAAFAAQVAATVGQAGAIPNIEANLPPIGMGAAARTSAIESTIIIPSGVLAASLDEVMRRRAAVPEPDSN